MNTTRKVASITLILLSITALIIISPHLPTIAPQTTISISQIYVDPQGSEIGNEWKGSYWNILTYINANDQIAGVILPKDQTGAVTYNGAVTALKTGAKIEIKIDPQQPYLTRGLIERTTQVTSEVGRTYQNMYMPSYIGEDLTRKAQALMLNYF